MTRDEARVFLVTLQQMQPYVPPMIFNGIGNSNVTREIELCANMPEPDAAGQAGGNVNTERPKPKAVT